MRTKKAITLRLEPMDYERLAVEARRRGVAPAALARVYVRTGLNGQPTIPDQRRLAGLAALDRLAELTADLPLVDAVELVRKGRRELASRPHL